MTTCQVGYRKLSTRHGAMAKAPASWRFQLRLYYDTSKGSQLHASKAFRINSWFAQYPGRLIVEAERNPFLRILGDNFRCGKATGACFKTQPFLPIRFGVPSSNAVTPLQLVKQSCYSNTTTT
jgi:hypothetical protein